MQTNPTNPNIPLENGKWPDFYAILETQPELDNKQLRHVISDCYQQASNKMDHRDLSVRFYNQVLTQKVLPACRRILLNPEIRARYDEQLRFHRAGDAGAISYSEFVELTQTRNTCTLDINELSILPSIDGQASHTPLQALNVPRMPQKENPPRNEAIPLSLEPTIAPTVSQQPAKKPLPLAAIASVGVVLLGAGGYLLTRSSPAPINAEPAVAVASVAPSKSSDGPTPALMKLNTVAKNGDFEDKADDSWKITGSPGAAFLDDAFNNDAKSGRRVLNFWTKPIPAGKPSKTARVTQQISNLENGTYTLKAWVRRSGKQKEFYMFVSDYGGAVRKINMDVSKPTSWTQLSMTNINVTNGQCTIGFYGDNLADWINVDAIELFRA